MTATQRRRIEAVFAEHGRTIKMRVDDDSPANRLIVMGEYGEAPVLVGDAGAISMAIDVRDNGFVPNCYDDEASTWA